MKKDFKPVKAMRKPPGEFIKNPTSIRSEKQLENYKNTFDIRTLTLAQLARDLKVSLDKEQPKSIFFKGRQNRKLELDNERRSLLLSGIAKLRAHNAELLQLNADAFLTNEMFNHLVSMRQLQFQAEIEKSVSELTVYKKEVEVKLAAFDLEIEKFIYQKESLETNRLREREALLNDILENDARRKMIERITIENKHLDERLALENESRRIANQEKIIDLGMKKRFLDEIDVKALPYALQVQIMSHLFGGSNYSDFERQQIEVEFLGRILEQDVRRKKYEANTIRSQARSADSQADIDRAKADKSTDQMKDLK